MVNPDIKDRLKQKSADANVTVKDSKCVYMCISMLSEAFFKGDDGEVYGPCNLACIKIGKTHRSLYKRMIQHTYEHDVLTSIPILQCTPKGKMGIDEFEKTIKKELAKFNVKISCSVSKNFKIPQELFIVSIDVVNSFKGFAKNNDMDVKMESTDIFDFSKLKNNDDFLAAYEEHVYNLFDNEDTIEYTTITSPDDSLTTEQIRIFRNNMEDIVYKKLGLPRQPSLSE